MQRLLAFAAASVPGIVGLLLHLLGLSASLAWLAATAVGAALGWVWCRHDRQQMRWIVALIATLLAPLLLAGFAVNAIHVVAHWYPTTPLRHLAQADRVVAVPDGVVRTELEGSDFAADRPHNDNSLGRDYVVAPLVNADWTRREPATTWVQCEGDREPCNAMFRNPPLIGKALRRQPDQVRAIAAAVAEHHLVTPPEVLVLEIHSESTLDAWATLVACGLGLIVLNIVAARRTVAGP